MTKKSPLQVVGQVVAHAQEAEKALIDLSEAVKWRNYHPATRHTVAAELAIKISRWFYCVSDRRD